MRKCVAIILVLLSVLGMYAIGQAKPLYEQYWESGAYTVEITEEDRVRLAALWEQVEMLSAGTWAKFRNGFTTMLARLPGRRGCRTRRPSPRRRHTFAPAWSWRPGMICSRSSWPITGRIMPTSPPIRKTRFGRLTLFAMTVRNTTRPPSLCTPMTAAFVEYNMKCRMAKGGKSQ